MALSLFKLDLAAERNVMALPMKVLFLIRESTLRTISPIASNFLPQISPSGLRKSSSLLLFQPFLHKIAAFFHSLCNLSPFCGRGDERIEQIRAFPSAYQSQCVYFGFFK